MILASSAPLSGAEVTFKRKSPASRELLEVGLILGSGGQSNGIWGKILNPTEGEIRRTGMIFTKVMVPADPKVAESFSNTVRRRNCKKL